MFKNEVTHTISCREASSGMGLSFSGFVYLLCDGNARFMGAPSAEGSELLRQKTKHRPVTRSDSMSPAVRDFPAAWLELGSWRLTAASWLQGLRGGLRLGWGTLPLG